MPSFPRRLIALTPFALVFFLCLASLSARAQTAVEQPPAYRAVIEEALAEYRLGHFVEARALFAEAHQIYPNARTLRGLGMASFELRNYRESIGYLEQALASEVKPLDGRLRSETESLLKRAYRFVARLNLVLTPDTTSVTIDGHPVTLEPDKPLLLEAGPHSFVFAAEGYQSEQRELDVKGREILTWTIQLAPVPPPPPPPPAPAAEPVPAVPTPAEAARAAEPAEAAPQPPLAPGEGGERRDRPAVYKNPWLWVGVGVAVTAVAVGVGVAASRDPRSVEGQPVRTPNIPRGAGIINASWSSP